MTFPVLEATCAHGGIQAWARVAIGAETMELILVSTGLAYILCHEEAGSRDDVTASSGQDHAPHAEATDQFPAGAAVG